MIKKIQIMKSIMIFLFIGLAVQLNAQDIIGDWHGKISYQGTDLRIVFHVTENNGKYQSTMDSPDQNATGITVDKTTFKNGKLVIEVNAIKMNYTAELDSSGKTLKGTFNQQGVSLPLSMTKGEEKTSSFKKEGMDSDENIQGDWNGLLDISGRQLLIVFHILNADGQLKSTMDSPDQNALGIPMDETRFEDGKLHIIAQDLNAEYTAELSEKADTMKGVFKQNGISFDLIMIREMIERETVIRPQEPKDYPYHQEEVKFENPNGGHHLAGTLTIPENGKFNKVVILISGSGPQDRNEEVQILNHKPFLVLSDYLTRQGIAVLRYDDRGVAESEGNFAGATSKDFAEDAAAAVAYLKTRKDMKGKAIGLGGHSEGGMIAPMVASENTDVDFIVLFAGPGIKTKELLLLQQDKASKAEGILAATRMTMAKNAKEMFEYIETNINLPKNQLITGVSKLLENGYAKLPDEEKQRISNRDNYINQTSRMLTSDWYLYLLRYNPDHYLSKVKCPVLAVNGELDVQVTSKENLEGIRKSLNRANNNNVTTHEFKGLNHLFQKTETGAASEYAALEETFNEQAMKYISKWILDLQI